MTKKRNLELSPTSHLIINLFHLGKKDGDIVKYVESFSRDAVDSELNYIPVFQLPVLESVLRMKTQAEICFSVITGDFLSDKACEKLFKLLSQRQKINTHLFIVGVFDHERQADLLEKARKCCTGIIRLESSSYINDALEGAFSGLYRHGVISYDFYDLLEILNRGNVFFFGSGQSLKGDSGVFDALDEAFHVLDRQGVIRSQITQIQIGFRMGDDINLITIDNVVKRIESTVSKNADIMFYTAFPTVLEQQLDIYLLASTSSRRGKID